MKKCLQLLVFFFMATSVKCAQPNENAQKIFSEIKHLIRCKKNIEIENALVMHRQNILDNNLLQVYDQIGLTLFHRLFLRHKLTKHLVRQFLSLGGDPNQKVSFYKKSKSVGTPGGTRQIIFNGWSVAHIAADRNISRPILKLIHEEGCNFLQQDDGGWSALDVARKYKEKAARKQIGKLNVNNNKVQKKNSINILKRNREIVTVTVKKTRRPVVDREDSGTKPLELILTREGVGGEIDASWRKTRSEPVWLDPKNGFLPVWGTSTLGKKSGYFLPKVREENLEEIEFSSEMNNLVDSLVCD